MEKHTLNKQSQKTSSTFRSFGINAFKRAIIFIFFSLFVTACSIKPDSKLIPSSVSSVKDAYAWQLTGKILIKIPDDKSSANLFWVHTPQQNEMNLTSVLGTNILSLEIQKQMTKLVFDGKSYQDKDPEMLLQRLTGWSVPVKLLPYWITGQFDKDISVISRNAQGLPTRLRTKTDFPWHINIASWQKLNGVQLPKLMLLEQGQLELKVKINHWQALKLTKNN